MLWKPALVAVLAVTSFAEWAQIISKPAEPRAEQSWMTDADYPEGVIRRAEEGTVRALLSVAPDGRVSECKIVRSSGSTLLDETTCRLAKRRARFHPAIDENGRAVPDVYLFRYSWTPG